MPSTQRSVFLRAFLFLSAVVFASLTCSGARASVTTAGSSSSSSAMICKSQADVYPVRKTWNTACNNTCYCVAPDHMDYSRPWPPTCTHNPCPSSSSSSNASAQGGIPRLYISIVHQRNFFAKGAGSVVEFLVANSGGTANGLRLHLVLDHGSQVTTGTKLSGCDKESKAKAMKLPGESKDAQRADCGIGGEEGVLPGGHSVIVRVGLSIGSNCKGMDMLTPYIADATKVLEGAPGAAKVEVDQKENESIFLTCNRAYQKICGNGIIDPPSEKCDAGPNPPNGACANKCKTILPGWACDGEPSVCATVCGDGVKTSDEECDTGRIANNFIPGYPTDDGCDDTCHTEVGWNCLGADGGKSICSKCGNGVLERGEECDDGNSVGGDGCSQKCQVEPGATCDKSSPTMCASFRCCLPSSQCAKVPPKEFCEHIFCGNGVMETGEECDDGNIVNGDGCDSHCKLESGYTPYMGHVSKPRCGNGSIEPGEECDNADMNGNTGRGCTTDCHLGGTCVVPPLPPAATYAPVCMPNGVRKPTFMTLEINSPAEQCAKNPQTTWKLGCNTCTCTSARGRFSQCTQNVCSSSSNSSSSVSVESIFIARAGVYPNDEFDASGLPSTTSPGTTWLTGPEGTVDFVYESSDKKTKGTIHAMLNHDSPWVALPTQFANGTYTMKAVYNGDGTHAPSKSNTVTINSSYTQFAGTSPAAVINANCGDGHIGVGESCDDGPRHCVGNSKRVCTMDSMCVGIGNGKCAPLSDGDGCSASCTTEQGWTCRGEPSVCSICGNGVLDSGEECDDGNTANGDGCTSTCRTEKAAWTCTSVPQEKSKCTRISVCGDGVIEAGETCDDGNSAGGDGCSAACTIENGWLCDDTTPSYCHQVVCGDGKVEGTEQCDDGNTYDGDICMANCKIRSGWMCNGSPSVCYQIPSCGNGAVEYGEQCDVGVASDPGCKGCILQSGYVCTGNHLSVCKRGTPVPTTLSMGSDIHGDYYLGHIFANITPSTVTGNVAFYSGANTLLGYADVVNGQAVLSLMLPKGQYSLKAHYSGDGVYAPAYAPKSIVINVLSRSEMPR